MARIGFKLAADNSDVDPQIVGLIGVVISSPPSVSDKKRIDSFFLDCVNAYRRQAT